MGRKQAAELSLEFPEDEPVMPPAETSAPRRVRSKPAAEAKPGWRSKVRRGFVFGGIGAVILGAVIGAYQLDDFLARDQHFLLLGPPQPNLAIQGVVYAPRAELVRVFAHDFGRSVYLMPLADRRRALLGIDWIKDASVVRHWPNRVEVRVTERMPVAFAILPSITGQGWTISEPVLVDSEGRILRPPVKARFSLPAIVGLTRQDTAEARRAKVQQASALIREVQSYAAQISEIDVSDPEDVNVTEFTQGRSLRLRLGTRNYLARLSGFLSHYPDISRRLPNARTFDLRLDDHITAQDGGPNGR